MSGLALGLDVGGSKVLAVVVDPAERVLGEVRLPTRRGAEGVLASATEAGRRVVELAGVSLAAVSVVGVGVPGLVVPGSGAVTNAVNLDLDAQAVPLAARLESRLGRPVVVENDVNAAAAGLHRLRLRHGEAVGDIALLSLGTGLAAGVVVEGRLHRGARGAAGEIGHVPVDPAGPLCACGQRGCLEKLASGSALVEAWPTEPLTGRDVWTAAAEGHPAAVTVLERYGAAVAAAVRLLVLTWDVETVVLGGGVTEVGAPFLDCVTRALTRAEEGSPFLRSLDLPRRVELVPPRSPFAAVGAAVLARESWADGTVGGRAPRVAPDAAS